LSQTDLTKSNRFFGKENAQIHEVVVKFVAKGSRIGKRNSAIVNRRKTQRAPVITLEAPRRAKIYGPHEKVD